MKTLKNIYKEVNLNIPHPIENGESNYEKNNYVKIKLNNQDYFYFDSQMWNHYNKNLKDQEESNNFDEIDGIGKFFSKEKIIENEIIFSSKIEGVDLEIKNIKNSNTEENKLNIEREQEKQVLNEAMNFLIKKPIIFLTHDLLSDLLNILSKDEKNFNKKTILGPNFKNLRYRDGSVGIFSWKNGTQNQIHSGVDSKLVEESLDNLFIYINDKLTNIYNGKPFNRYEVVNFLSIFHCLFEYIHPYFDGNGRIGRLIVMAICFKMPFRNIGVLLSEIINLNKSKFYDSLLHSQKTKLLNYHTIFMFNVFDESFKVVYTLNLILVALRQEDKTLTRIQFNHLKSLLLSGLIDSNISYDFVKDNILFNNKQSFFNMMKIFVDDLKILNLEVVKNKNIYSLKKEFKLKK